VAVLVVVEPNQEVLVIQRALHCKVEAQIHPMAAVAAVAVVVITVAVLAVMERQQILLAVGGQDISIQVL
jgi:hypothetical protein